MGRDNMREVHRFCSRQLQQAPTVGSDFHATASPDCEQLQILAAKHTASLQFSQARLDACSESVRYGQLPFGEAARFQIRYAHPILHPQSVRNKYEY